MKNKILILTIISYIIFSIYTLLSEDLKQPFMRTELHCGIVTCKLTKDIKYKHKTVTEYYFNVNYENIESKVIEVDIDTYYKFKEKQRACFNVWFPRSILIVITKVIGLLSLITIFVYLLTELTYKIINRK
jgi:hypothetical protein